MLPKFEEKKIKIFPFNYKLYYKLSPLFLLENLLSFFSDGARDWRQMPETSCVFICFSFAYTFTFYLFCE